MLAFLYPEYFKTLKKLEDEIAAGKNNFTLLVDSSDQLRCELIATEIEELSLRLNFFAATMQQDKTLFIFLKDPLPDDWRRILISQYRFPVEKEFVIELAFFANQVCRELPRWLVNACLEPTEIVEVDAAALVEVIELLGDNDEKPGANFAFRWEAFCEKQVWVEYHLVNLLITEVKLIKRSEELFGEKLSVAVRKLEQALGKLENTILVSPQDIVPVCEYIIAWSKADFLDEMKLVRYGLAMIINEAAPKWRKLNLL